VADVIRQFVLVVYRLVKIFLNPIKKKTIAGRKFIVGQKTWTCSFFAVVSSPSKTVSASSYPKFICLGFSAPELIASALGRKSGTHQEKFIPGTVPPPTIITTLRDLFRPELDSGNWARRFFSGVFDLGKWGSPR
jgi:hypothetical protein